MEKIISRMSTRKKTSFGVTRIANELGLKTSCGVKFLSKNRIDLLNLVSAKKFRKIHISKQVSHKPWPVERPFPHLFSSSAFSVSLYRSNKQPRTQLEHRKRRRNTFQNKHRGLLCSTLWAVDCSRCPSV